MAFPVQEDHRFYCPHRAVVIANRDPLGLHRVRARIAGFVEDTGWATPPTAGGGGPQWGGHAVPREGSDVIVQFCGGHPEDPVYSGGHWGIRDPEGSELPFLAQVQEAEFVSFFQFGRLLVRADMRARDEETGSGQTFEVADTLSETYLRMDLAKQAVAIHTDYLLDLRSTGIVRIEGAQVQIQGRLVKAGKKEI